MAEVLNPTPHNPTAKSSYPSDTANGSLTPPSSSVRNDSAVQVSPPELPRPGYSRPHQHRIIPPSIKGHGRLIIAHRVVPYWVGIIVVIFALAWAVWCALFVFPLLGGHRTDRKLGVGEGGR